MLQVQIPNCLQKAINGPLSCASHRNCADPSCTRPSATTSGGWSSSAFRRHSGYIARLFLLETAYDIEYDLRNIIYEHLTKMSFSFYDRVQSGQLISRANSDIRSVQMYMTFAPSILVQCSIAVVAFIYMLSIDVPLAFVAMATMPFVYLAGVQMRKSMFPVSWIIQSRLADVATIVDENVNGVRVVKSFAAEQQQLTALSSAADRLQWSYMKDADLRARFSPVVQNLPQLGLALVLLFGGYMVIHGGLGVGDIVEFNFYLLMLQAPFMMLGMLIMMGQRAAASADRIYEIIDEQPTVTDRPGAVDLVDCKGDVRFSHVDFAYAQDAEHLVLADFDVHISPGETVALVGRTGAGKSTVARLLTRFYDVKHGSVTIDGIDIRDITLDSLRANVGMVLDEPFLFSASVRDNIAYGKPIGIRWRRSGLRQRWRGPTSSSSSFLTATTRSLASAATPCPGGQRQRIAIARTLLVNPPIMVLDDATSAIDVKVEQTIHAGLREQMEGRTTLIVAHRLSTISLADRVLLLDHQKIVADGTHAELLESTPLYTEVLAQAGAFEEARRTGQQKGRTGLKKRSVAMVVGGAMGGMGGADRSAGSTWCRASLRRHPLRASGRGGQTSRRGARASGARFRLHPERRRRRTSSD